MKPKVLKRNRKPLALLIVATLMATPVILFRLRYCRSITLHNLTAPQTQTVAIAFMPSHVKWEISGTVQGTGTVLISYGDGNQRATLPEIDSNGVMFMTNKVAHYLSARVNGTFTTNGSGDWYGTNLSLIFVPDGQATGKIQGSFFFHNFY